MLQLDDKKMHIKYDEIDRILTEGPCLPKEEDLFLLCLHIQDLVVYHHRINIKLLH